MFIWSPAILAPLESVGHSLISELVLVIGDLMMILLIKEPNPLVVGYFLSLSMTDLRVGNVGCVMRDLIRYGYAMTLLYFAVWLFEMYCLLVNL